METPILNYELKEATFRFLLQQTPESPHPRSSTSCWMDRFWGNILSGKQWKLRVFFHVLPPKMEIGSMIDPKPKIQILCSCYLFSEIHLCLPSIPNCSQTCGQSFPRKRGLPPSPSSQGGDHRSGDRRHHRGKGDVPVQHVFDGV